MKRFNVAIAGINKVGIELARKIVAQGENSAFKLTVMAGKGPTPNLEGVAFYDDVEAIHHARNVDIVIEALGGGSRAYDLAAGSLDRCRHVVTANVPLLAGHLEILTQIARDKNVQLRFDSAIMGSVPALHTACSIGTDVNKICGILNGSSNFILQRMEEFGETFETARRAAVELEMAAPNCQMDTGGRDTLYKIALLRYMAFGVKTDFTKTVPVGMDKITPDDMVLARKLGYVVRLVGTATATEIMVQPQLVAEDSLLGNISYASGGVVFETSNCGSVLLAGETGGADVVVSGLMADLMAIPLNRRPMMPQKMHKQVAMSTTDVSKKLYVRLPIGSLSAMPNSAEVRVSDEVKSDDMEHAAVMLEGVSREFVPSSFTRVAEAVLPVLL